MSGLTHRVHRVGGRVVVELFGRSSSEARARTLVVELLTAGEVAELLSVDSGPGGAVFEFAVTRADDAPAVWT